MARPLCILCLSLLSSSCSLLFYSSGDDVGIDGDGGEAPLSDAAGGGDAQVGVGDAGGPLEFTAPEPVSIAGITAPMQIGAQDDPSISPNRAELFFNHSDGSTDIAVATRSGVGFGDPWESSAKLELGRTSGYDTSPEIAGDGLSLLFVSNRSGGPGGDDVYVATRDSLAESFGNPTLVSSLSTSENEVTSSPVSIGGTDYVVVSRNVDADNRDLLLYSGTNGGPWSLARSLDEINGNFGRMLDPFLSYDGLELYFTHSNPDMGDADLWVAARSSSAPGAPFGVPTLLDSVNSTSEDSDPFLGADGTFYFTSNRSGTRLLYRAQRQ